MGFFENIPGWLGGAIAGALATPLVKIGIDALARSRKRRLAAIESLEELKSLLAEAWSTVQSQNSHRNRLHELLLERHGESVRTGLGYDEDFFRMYNRMNEEEREIFRLIRGLTKHGLFKANTRISSWLDSNRSIKRVFGKKTPTIENLDQDLSQLGRHLTEWFSKYHSVFAEDPNRSLVYLADEKEQGTGFPTRIRKSIDQALMEIGD